MSASSTIKLSIFEKLPYDVRVVIYAHLEPGDLPPLSPGYRASTAGCLLSCRAAKFDLDGIATTRLTGYYKCFGIKFAEFTGLEHRILKAPTHNLSSQLRQVTIVLPFTSFAPFSQHQCQWKRNMLIALHPLFIHYFDKVHIHFFGSEGRPASNTLFDRGKVEVRMHSLLRDLGYMIARVNREGADENSKAIVDSIFPYVSGEDIREYPGVPVRAKRICLSWNLLDEHEEALSSDAHVLNGRQHKMPGIELDKPQEIFYYLCNRQRTIGEIGMVSEQRWKDISRINFSVLLNGQSTLNEYCSSDGVGRELRTGLSGISKEEFESCEAEVGSVVFA